MKVIQVTTADGLDLYANAIPKGPHDITISSMNMLEMTDEEFESIPAKFGSFRCYRPHPSETPGAVVGFERRNREN